MGQEDAGFRGIRQLQKEINRCLGGRYELTRPDRKERPLTLETRLNTVREEDDSSLRGRLPFVLFSTSSEDRYREVPLERAVDDAAVIFPVGQISLNPQDARRQRIEPGDRVIISRGRQRWIWPARITGRQPAGTLHVVLPPGQTMKPNPARVRLKKYR